MKPCRRLHGTTAVAVVATAAVAVAANAGSDFGAGVGVGARRLRRKPAENRIPIQDMKPGLVPGFVCSANDRYRPTDVLLHRNG